MPDLTPYQLTFTGGLHVGTHGVGLEASRASLPSDTLFAAVVDALSRSGVSVDAFLQPFLEPSYEPPFLLSSSFPFAGEVRFYPLPVDLAALFAPETLRERGKRLKRIRYFSEALLLRALAGERLDDWLFPADETQEPESGLALQQGAVWLTVDEVAGLPGDFQHPPGRRRALRYRALWSQGRVPRVTIGRVTSAATVFQAGRVTFAAGCGLWLGVAWRQPGAQVAGSSAAYRTVFQQALAQLQEDGLGGERSAGYGAFRSAERAPLSLPDPQAGQPAYLLSRYLPRESELPTALTDGRAAYRLASVGGWLRSPDGAAQRRPRIYLLTAGSLVCPPVYPAGRLIDLRPRYTHPEGDLPHPVYRSGLALAVGWRVGSGEEVRHG